MYHIQDAILSKQFIMLYKISIDTQTRKKSFMYGKVTLEQKKKCMKRIPKIVFLCCCSILVPILKATSTLSMIKLVRNNDDIVVTNGISGPLALA